MLRRTRANLTALPPLGGRGGALHRVAACLALTAALAGAARADEEPPPSAKEDVEEVQQSLQEEITEESPEERRERWLHRPGLLHPERWTVEWRNGFHVVREDGAYELLLGAQTSVEGAVYHLDERLLPSESGWELDADFRRARVFGQGVLFTRLYFKLAYDFADTEWADVYGGILDVGPARAIQIGYMSSPFGLEQSTNLHNLTFLEGSLVSALTPKKQLGILATGVLFDQRVRWALGTFFIDDSIRQEDDTVEGLDDDWAVTLRVNGTPIWEDEGARMLLIGASYTHATSNGQQLSLSVRPETRLVDPLIETVAVAVDGLQAAGYEVAWVDGPWSIQSEGVWGSVDRSDGGTDGSWGAYVQGSRFLTGERRIYGRASGVFGRVIPSRPFSPGSGDWGALELAARASYIDVGGPSVAGSREWNLTLGVNWYLRANARVAANYIHGHVAGEGDMNVLQARFQFDF